MFAFVDVNIIPMDRDRVMEGQTVVVVDDRIASIRDAEEAAIPAGAIRIEASGQYLIPALSDMHVHLEGDAWNAMFPPEEQFPPEALDFGKLLFPYVANGVATVQVMSALPEHIDLRESIARGELLGPRLLLARMIDGPGRAWPPPISTWVSSPEEARQAVLDSHREGYDSIKVYSFLDRATYEAIMAAAGEIGMGVGGHIPYELSLEEVLEAGQNLIAHSEEVMKFAQSPYTQDQIEGIARTIADSGAWITPTLTTSRNILAVLEDFDGELSRPEVRYLHPMDRGIWSFIYTNLYQPIPQDQRTAIRDGYLQFQRPLTGALNAVGARMMTGTDSLIPSNVPGFSIHDELAELVDVGLSPFEALRSSTTEPFAFLGELDQAGTIEVGKQADLVLLQGNPLTDIAETRRISGVMLRGRWLAQEDLEQNLEALAVSYQRRTRDSSGDNDEVTPSSHFGDKRLEPRSGVRYIAWGVSPRIPAPINTISRGAATDVRAGGLRLTPQPIICRPSRAFFNLSSLPWGSRPRLNICRASGAPFKIQRPTHDSRRETRS